MGSPLLLATDKEDGGMVALSVIESGKASIVKVYIFGGKSSVSEELEAALQGLLH